MSQTSVFIVGLLVICRSPGGAGLRAERLQHHSMDITPLCSTQCIIQTKIKGRIKGLERWLGGYEHLLLLYRTWSSDHSTHVVAHNLF